EAETAAHAYCRLAARDENALRASRYSGARRPSTAERRAAVAARRAATAPEGTPMSLTELDGHAFDALPTAILVANPDGRIVIANRRAATLLGYRSAELAGLPLEAVIAEPSGAALRRRIAGLAVRRRRAD